MEVKCNLDIKKFDNKPEGKEIGGVQNRLEVGQTTIDTKELSEHLASGATFKPALLEGKDSSSIVSQQTFGIDVDGKTTIKEQLERAEQLRIPPNFGYTTFNHLVDKGPKGGGIQERFRLVFTTPVPITDLRVRNAIQFALLRLFPKADQVCKDPARLFFGGRSLICSNYEATIDPYELIQTMIATIRAENPINAAREIKAYCQVTGLNMINGLPDVRLINNDDFEENDRNSIIIYNSTPGEIFKKVCFNFNIDNTEAADTANTDKKKAPKYDIKAEKSKIKRREDFKSDALKDNCRLFREAVSDETWLEHKEIFGMATNLVYVEGGETIMLEDILQQDFYNEIRANKEHTVKSVGCYGYAPMQCDNFCRYCNECNHNKNMLQQVDAKLGEVRKIKDLEVSELRDTETMLQDAILEAHNSEDTKIHVIKSNTGIGKTEMLCGLDLNNTCVALPTHKLKKELIKRLEKVGQTGFLNAVPRPTFPEPFETQAKKMQQLGIFDEVKKIASAVVNSKGYILPEEVAKMREIRDYLKMLDDIKKASKIVCTHERSYYITSSNINTVIFDEDPTRSSLLKIYTIPKEDIEKLSYIALSLDERKAEPLLKLISYINKAEVHDITKIPKTTFTKGQLKEIKQVILNGGDNLSSNLLGLFDCTFIEKKEDGSVMGISRRNLDEKKKYIILSATANELVYRKLFGDRLVFTDLGETEKDGKLYLHAKKSYSRSTIESKKEFDKMTTIMEEAVEQYKLAGIITYKGITEKDGDKMYVKGHKEIPVIATFGATEGIDAYAGKNIAVFGTPHINPTVYMLYTAILNVDITLGDQLRSNERVCINRNGYEFFLYTYVDSTLTELQCWLIESELIQAVGRSRLLRNPCEVHLYSNFPIPGCEIIE